MPSGPSPRRRFAGQPCPARSAATPCTEKEFLDDLRGHGESDPAKGGDYAIERFGEDLEAVLAQVAFFERMLVTTPPDVRGDIGIAMSEMDLHQALPRLTVPTIVIAGALDRLTPPSHARRIAEMLPGSCA